MESNMKEAVGVSRLPKPFSIESLISKHTDKVRPPSSSPPSPHQQSSPPIDSLAAVAACHPATAAMLPFPLYNPWIAGYLSQQQNQFLNDSQTAPPPTGLSFMSPANYLLSQNRHKLAQYFGVPAAVNGEKLSDMFGEYQSIISDGIGFGGSVTMMMGSKGYNPAGVDSQKDPHLSLDIESAESCGSDISMRSSPSPGSVGKNRGEKGF